ncbi:MAG: type VI secretion system-associated protein TagF [Methylovirgula sp.]
MNTGAAAEAAAGLYGKLPSSRDFLRRGLPNGFVTPWDHWLAHVLAASQRVLGEDWLNAYLTSPPWRFALDPHLLGHAGWLGVVVSSVDALHRAFPLTLAAANPDAFADLARVFDCERWMARTENLALAMIDESRGVEEGAADLRLLADEIGASAAHPQPSRGASAEDADAPWSQAYELAGATQGPGRVLPQSHVFSYWWHGDWPGHPAIALRCRGLPDLAAAACFFDAGWRERGLIQAPQPRSP